MMRFDDVLSGINHELTKRTNYLQSKINIFGKDWSKMEFGAVLFRCYREKREFG